MVLSLVRFICIIEELFIVVVDISIEIVGLELDDSVGVFVLLYVSGIELLFGNLVKEVEVIDFFLDCWEYKFNWGFKDLYSLVVFV